MQSPSFFLLHLVVTSLNLSAEEVWKKHVVTDAGKSLTAVAADFDGDGRTDVIASLPGRVSLFTAPDWKEVVLHKHPRKNATCIHSEIFDIDGDGDMDWVGGEASGNPFWLENSGGDGAWKARVIDTEIKGMHCYLRADVDKDGKIDLITNNFDPEGALGNSVVWYSIPDDVRSAAGWERHVFAKGDAPGGSHYFGFGDINGDSWGEIAVAAKGGLLSPRPASAPREVPTKLRRERGGRDMGRVG